MLKIQTYGHQQLGERRSVRFNGFQLRPEQYALNHLGESVYVGAGFKDVMRSIGNFLKSAGRKAKPIIKALAPVARDLALEYGPAAIDLARGEAIKKLNDKNFKTFGKTDQARKINKAIVNTGSDRLKSFLQNQKKRQQEQQKTNQYRDREAQKLERGYGLYQKHQIGGMSQLRSNVRPRHSMNDGEALLTDFLAKQRSKRKGTKKF